MHFKSWQFLLVIITMFITFSTIFSLIWSLLLATNSHKQPVLEPTPKKTLALQLNNYYSQEVIKRTKKREGIKTEEQSTLTDEDYDTVLSEGWLGKSLGEYLRTKRDIFEVSPSGSLLRVLNRSIESGQEDQTPYVWLVRGLTDSQVGPNNAKTNLNIFDIKLQDTNIFWFTLLWSDTKGLIHDNQSLFTPSMSRGQL